MKNTSLLRRRVTERGSIIFFVLVAVVLFAALTYAISHGGDGARSLSKEKVKLLASEIIDTGNRISETVSRLRLKGVRETEVSFEYNGDYVNAGCLTDACKIFAFDGGGLEWESAPAASNNGESWGYTADMAITNIGTASADLVMFLPNISADLCHRINVLLDIEDDLAPPPSVGTSVTADEFTGTYNATPVTITEASIDGKKSGCLQVGTLSGTAVTGSPLTTPYLYYQVLLAR